MVVYYTGNSHRGSRGVTTNIIFWIAPLTGIKENPTASYIFIINATFLITDGADESIETNATKAEEEGRFFV